MHLVRQDEEATRVAGQELFKRVIADYSGDRLQVLSATEQLGITFADAGDPDQAANYLRQVLQLIAESVTGRSGTTGMTEVLLAGILIAKGHRADMQEAKTLLDAVKPEISRMRMFRDSVLRYLVAQARVAEALGDVGAESFASDSLAVAAELEPSIPLHPDLGRPIASPKVREEMRRIAGVSSVESPQRK
ncbi:hypothetical protein N1028_08055 [Herbiconiux sp. CPCC 203407]|uniref:Tetratricopeptide repeat protein n=1 Tax=Herbiconiux oxytropis TaxID=2970915 RepID=A0AA41XGL5_9MICO|nr:hypothetical protein [Herbiconiux oxytropis]MCS5722891.1 hypothetical protein [Herbiconiux oxytropis]MCS5725849.1 hypothetical protein [Herbiconiux oxytropis]